MNAAIVDDSAEDIELLCSYLSRYSREHNVHMYIEKFTDEDAFILPFKTGFLRINSD